MRKMTHRFRRHLALFMAAALAPWFADSTAAQSQQSTGDDDDSVASLYADFLHFSRLGKFTEADAYGKQLLEHPDLTPTKLLKASDTDKHSLHTLLTLIKNTSISDRAQAILDVIREGEHEARKDRARIRDNVQKLGGAPQIEYNAIQRLRDSGEYAIPVMIDVLLDQSQKKLWPRVIRALPQIGKGAVTPLVMALGIDDANVRQNVIWALGELGYPQATPYLLKILSDPNQDSLIKQAAGRALDRIYQSTAPPADTGKEFSALANQYYVEEGSVKADPRVATANIWYLTDNRITAVPVPTEIFGPIMAMRCCEEALLQNPDSVDAIALWLAANIRREARLGMDVESAEPDAGADADQTRPEDFPRSIYFSRAAGPTYSHRVLGRAVEDRDKQVALGAIAALDVVAGAKSLVGDESYKRPLVDALRFPDAEVRMKAAIAIARSLPKSAFSGADLVPHVLAETIKHRGEHQFVVVDADTTNRNRIAGELRKSGATVIADANFLAAMQRARVELPSITGFFLATDIESPSTGKAAEAIRKEYRFARTPIVILEKADQTHRSEQAVAAGKMIGVLDAQSNETELTDKLSELVEAGGGKSLSADDAVALAIRAVEALGLVAVNGNTVIDTAPAVPALIFATSSPNEALRVVAAHTLALIPSDEGQQAIAQMALDSGNDESVRLAAFDALAESAKRNGNRLSPEQVARVIETAADTSDLTISARASQALGALNLRNNQASEIIRNYYRG